MIIVLVFRGDTDPCVRETLFDEYTFNDVVAPEYLHFYHGFVELEFQVRWLKTRDRHRPGIS